MGNAYGTILGSARGSDLPQRDLEEVRCCAGDAGRAANKAWRKVVMIPVRAGDFLETRSSMRTGPPLQVLTVTLKSHELKEHSRDGHSPSRSKRAPTVRPSARRSGTMKRGLLREIGSGMTGTKFGAAARARA